MDDFAVSLSLADEVVLADIYPARETDTLGISSADLKEKLQMHGCTAIIFPHLMKLKIFYWKIVSTVIC